LDAEHIDEPAGVGAVRSQLIELIRSRRLAPGDKVGSERALANEFGVNRWTVRSVVDDLERAGIVTRRMGRGGGIFVSHRPIGRDLSRIVGLPEYLRAQGVTAGTRVISASTLAAEDAVADGLGITAGSFVFEIVRIRLADGTPLSLERARFPAAMFPGLVDHPMGGSMYELLETEYGIRPYSAVEEISAVAATADESRILELAQGEPLLSVTRRTSDETDTVFEYSQDLFRAAMTRIIAYPGDARTI
jgi:GntR family transcriptional regulator